MSVQSEMCFILVSLLFFLIIGNVFSEILYIFSRDFLQQLQNCTRSSKAESMSANEVCFCRKLEQAETEKQIEKSYMQQQQDNFFWQQNIVLTALKNKAFGSNRENCVLYLPALAKHTSDEHLGRRLEDRLDRRLDKQTVSEI